ncbi:putative malate dehydrogenase 1B [Gadus macrocephalus]|uniref:putative malate dehydrogenase 1B n=1 Tax=Gadus macrocephalus TaxID=80720 RepID=UPI0028CB1879|nr:putative malate dehydrogenase 1B [Gadus macrocephalus]
MARFVLAGKADCPHFAKAENLGDQLQGSLPYFRIHKILVAPDEWEEWLDDTCRSHGWRHSESPLVWRELLDRGGKGMLVGGLADFLEHCHEYYGVMSDMSTDMMLKIAVETREMEESWMEEKKLQASLRQPLNVWISGALNPTCSILIPHLLSEHIFPRAFTLFGISLHLLHWEGEEEALHALHVETEWLGLPLLHQVTAHAGLEEAFRDADLVILLDEEEDAGNQGGGEELKEKEEVSKEKEVREGDEEKEVGKLEEEREKVEKEEGGVRVEKKDEEVRDEGGQGKGEKVEEERGKVEEKEEQEEEVEEMTDEEAEEARRRKSLLQRISARYRRYGRLIGERARRRLGGGVRVMVAGDAHLNLKCALLAESAPSLDPGLFVAVATPLETAASARIALKLGMRTTDVRGVIVWGNPSGTFGVDLQRARVFDHTGAIQGPHSFSRPVLEVLHDRTWLKTDLPELLKGRGATSASDAGGVRPASVSVAHGILAVLRVWNGVPHPEAEGRVLSLGVCCQGHPYVPDGVVCSVPVTLSEGRWSPVLEGVDMEDELEETLTLAVDELRQEKEEGCSDL